jgi:hypothetical protein
MKRTRTLVSAITLCFILFSGVEAQQRKKRAQPQQKTNPPQKTAEQATSESRIDSGPRVTIDRVGITFTRLAAWWNGKWPSSYEASLNRVETDLLKFLKSKSSSSDPKLELVKVNNVEEARTRGIPLIYAVDYREEAAELKADDVIGSTSDIFCTFQRVDQLDVATNWDGLSVAAKGFVWGSPYNQMIRRELVFLADFLTAIPILEVSNRQPRSTTPGKAQSKQNSTESVASKSNEDQKQSSVRDPNSSTSSVGANAARSDDYSLVRSLDYDRMQPEAIGLMLHVLSAGGPKAAVTRPYLLWELGIIDQVKFSKDMESASLGELALNVLTSIGPTGIEAIFNALQADNATIRAKAAWGLARLKDVRVVEALIKALNDESDKVRKQAIQGLERLKDKRAVEPLIAVMKSEPSDAASALGEIGDPRAVDVLIDLLMDKNQDYLKRGRAAEALGKIKDARAVEPLIEALRQGKLMKGDKILIGQSIMTDAAHALGRIKDKRAVDPLIDAMEDIPSAAASALGEIGDARAVQSLISALKDKGMNVFWRRDVINALRKLTGKDLGDDPEAWRAWWEQNQKTIR